MQACSLGSSIRCGGKKRRRHKTRATTGLNSKCIENIVFYFQSTVKDGRGTFGASLVQISALWEKGLVMSWLVVIVRLG